MTEYEAQALLIRYNRAITLLEQEDEDGRWELLAHVIIPTEAVLQASLEEARTSGASNLARDMARTRQPKKGGRPRKISRPGPPVQASVVWTKS